FIPGNRRELAVFAQHRCGEAVAAVEDGADVVAFDAGKTFVDFGQRISGDGDDAAVFDTYLKVAACATKSAGRFVPRNGVTASSPGRYRQSRRLAGGLCVGKAGGRGGGGCH